MDRFGRAVASGADVVVIDLEDAVPPGDKDRARAELLSNAPSGHLTVVRINAAGTPWIDDDIAAVRELGVSVRGVMVPKAESGTAISQVAGDLGPDVEVIPLIESARGVVELPALCSSPGVVRLAFGTLDFGVDTGIEVDDALDAVRVQLVLQSRGRGLASPVDGVTTTADDDSLIAGSVRRARALGFGGKLCIHPSQIAAVHTALAPDEQEVAWALRVVHAEAELNGRPFLLDGAMVDPPVVARARKVLAHAGLPNR